MSIREALTHLIPAIATTSLVVIVLLVHFI